jgi:hypothetical protein
MARHPGHGGSFFDSAFMQAGIFRQTSVLGAMGHIVAALQAPVDWCFNAGESPFMA